MTHKEAYKRYLSVFLPSMAVYIATVFGAVLLIKNGIVTYPLHYAIALIPGLAALTFLWAHFRFIRETDEFHRKVQTEAVVLGTIALLAVAMTWGMISMFTDFVELPFFYAIPIFYSAYGIASVILSRKYGASCVIL